MVYMIQIKIIYQLICGGIDGDEIKNIFNRLFSKKLSRDALDILEIALLTNSSPNKKYFK